MSKPFWIQLQLTTANVILLCNAKILLLALVFQILLDNWLINVYYNVLLTTNSVSKTHHHKRRPTSNVCSTTEHWALDKTCLRNLLYEKRVGLLCWFREMKKTPTATRRSRWRQPAINTRSEVCIPEACDRRHFHVMGEGKSEGGHRWKEEEGERGEGKRGSKEDVPSVYDGFSPLK